MVEVRESGYLVVEVTIAVVMLGILMSVAFVADAGQLRQVANAFAETKAGYLAAGELERLRASVEPPKPGETALTFSPEDVDRLPQLAGVLRARRLEEPGEYGLWEVAVEIRWRPPGATTWRSITLTTWLDREAVK